MMDFQIKRSGRRCHSTERDLLPGEEFYSELIEEDDEIARRDYCKEAWKGPDDSSIGWWQATIPQIEGGRIYWAPRDVLIAYFESLQANEKRRSTAYVMALLLVRKRTLQLVDSETVEGTEVLELRSGKEGATWNVPVVELTDDEIREIQQELSEQLFMDQPPE